MAKEFHFIDQATKTVYIPLEDGEEACCSLLSGYATRAQYRKAGKYSVNICEQHYQALVNSGDITTLDEDSAVLTNGTLYSQDTGLSLKADTGRAEFI